MRMEKLASEPRQPKAIVEKIGMYYEECEVGDIVEHRPGRTICEADNTWFTLLTMNRHPVHFDAHFAESAHFGKVLVNSCLTLSVVTGMTVSVFSANAVANLGWDQVKLPAPVFVGDTIYARSEVIGKRKSAKHSGNGIITIRMTGYNQHGVVILEGNRTFMVPCAKEGN